MKSYTYIVQRLAIRKIVKIKQNRNVHCLSKFIFVHAAFCQQSKLFYSLKFVALLHFTLLSVRRSTKICPGKRNSACSIIENLLFRISFMSPLTVLPSPLRAFAYPQMQSAPGNTQASVLLVELVYLNIYTDVTMFESFKGSYCFMRVFSFRYIP